MLDDDGPVLESGDAGKTSMRWALARGDVDAAQRSRREFREFLALHSAKDPVAHELIFGELVANAVRHGAEPMSAEVRIEGGVVHTNVASRGTFSLEGRLESPSPTVGGGRGLGIVDSLADEFTVSSSGDTAYCKTRLKL
jgi:anti-sigma regulatory factor (Ser/Thr protein kinase)